MPSHFDIYVISDKRDSESIESFLNEFLPLREESADEYEYSQFSDTSEDTYRTARDIIQKCCTVRNSEYALYWRALENRKPEHAMVFFLPDSHIIFGLSTDDAYPEYANEVLASMKTKLNSSIGYIGHEASPDVSDLEEFKQQVIAHKGLTG